VSGTRKPNNQETERQRYEQTRSDSKHVTSGGSEEALPETRLPARAGIRDHGSVLPENGRDVAELQPDPEILLSGDRAVEAEQQTAADRAGCEIMAQALREGRDIRLRVTGSSMLPSIWPHDMLRIRAAGNSQPSIGEIILYARDGRLIAHRVVRRPDPGIARFETRGDALPACDAPVVQAEILGFVTAIVRGSREVPVRAGKSVGAIAFALRKSDLLCRIVLKLHAMRKRWVRPDPNGSLKGRTTA